MVVVGMNVAAVFLLFVGTSIDHSIRDIRAAVAENSVFVERSPVGKTLR